uniref:Uncharacterized protein n=2 Tax=Strongyloides stercoralis TaxID=6248 RepID=A0AAF5I0Z3_STRER
MRAPTPKNVSSEVVSLKPLNKIIQKPKNYGNQILPRIQNTNVLVTKSTMNTSKSLIPDYKKEAIENVKLTKSQQQKIMNLHKSWYNQAINGLIGVMGNDLISRLSNMNEKIALLQCLESIEYININPKYPAQCLILAKDKQFRRLKRQSLRFRGDYHKNIENNIDNNIIKTHEMPQLKTKQSENSLIKSIVKLFSNVVSFVDPKKRNKKIKPWKETYKKISKLNKIMKSNRINLDNSYKRVFDFVAEGQPEQLIRIARSLVKPKSLDIQFQDLIYTFEKYYSGKETPSILSPRFASILPSKYQKKENKSFVLSPNIFPLYQDESESLSKYDILPIPKIMDELGMNEKDKEAVLEMIMDITGVDTIVEEVENVLKTNVLGDDIETTTAFISNTFKIVEKTFNIKQKRDIENKKFSFLSPKQLDTIYGENGPYQIKRSKFPFSIGEYKKMTFVDKKRALWNTIREISEIPDPIAKKRGGSRFFSRRFKRTLTLKLDHTTLSPFAFSPSINTFTLLGPTTLSPSIFSPSIIAPYLLSPPVLSPQVGNPMIFSPYVLGPNVLSAAVFNAYVFTPYVLSPNVINPYVLSPVILSPFVLCPDVLSPTVLSGVILSPSVLSPSVLTDTILAVNVLSPTFLS